MMSLRRRLIVPVVCLLIYATTTITATTAAINAPLPAEGNSPPPPRPGAGGRQPVAAGQGHLSELEKKMEQYKLPTSNMSASEFKERLNQALSGFADSFHILLPPSEAVVKEGLVSKTLTQRYVYAPHGSRLKVPCSTDSKHHSKFSWSPDEAIKRLSAKKPGRVKKGSQMELIFEDLEDMDSGPYECSAKSGKVLHRNTVEIRVFTLADVAISVPLMFRAAHCNKDEERSVTMQVMTIMCPASEAVCPIDLTVTCMSNQVSEEGLPALLQVRILMHSKKALIAAPDCDKECIMKEKLKKTLAEATDHLTRLKHVYSAVVSVDECSGENCAREFVFLPDASLAEIQILYSCKQGYVIYRTSGCVPCFPGRIAPERGPNHECTPCPPNSYQPDLASSRCLLCRESGPDTMKIGATDIGGCHVDMRQKVARIIGLLSMAVGFLTFLIVVCMCIVWGERICVIWKLTSKEPDSKTGADEKVPLAPARTPGTLRVKGSSRDSGLHPSLSGPTTPQQSLYPPPPEPPYTGAPIQSLPSSSSAPSTDTTTMSMATGDWQSRQAPGQTNPEISRNNSSHPSTSSGPKGHMTPITVASNDPPAEIIRKAIEKVAPNMKLQSLKIKTGNETNVLTLPPNYYSADRTNGKTLPPPAPAPAPAHGLAPAATSGFPNAGSISSGGAQTSPRGKTVPPSGFVTQPWPRPRPPPPPQPLQESSQPSS